MYFAREYNKVAKLLLQNNKSLNYIIKSDLYSTKAKKYLKNYLKLETIEEVDDLLNFI